MTQEELFNALSKGGAYSLPYLLKLNHPAFGTWYVVNNNEPVQYEGHTYTASAFKYTRPKTIGGVLKNGSLEITALQSRLIELLEVSDELFTVDVIGILDQAGDITPVNSFHHQYGTVTLDNTMKVTITFTNDDRLDMNFPPYLFDSENNRGNA